jgi:hypothetical protein
MHFITLFWKLLFAFVPPTGEITLPDNFLNTDNPLLARGCTFRDMKTNSRIIFNNLRKMIKKFAGLTCIYTR